MISPVRAPVDASIILYFVDIIILGSWKLLDGCWMLEGERRGKVVIVPMFDVDCHVHSFFYPSSMAGTNHQLSNRRLYIHLYLYFSKNIPIYKYIFNKGHKYSPF